MRNYKETIEKAKEFPALKWEVEEVEEMRSKGFNIKNNIEDIKQKLTSILKEKERNNGN